MKTILSGPVPCCSAGTLVYEKITAMVHTRPTKVQGMALERTLLALKDSDGTKTLLHTCLRIEDGGQVCGRRWYHP